MSGKKMVACSRVTDEEGGDDGRFRFTSFCLKKGNRWADRRKWRGGSGVREEKLEGEGLELAPMMTSMIMLVAVLLRWSKGFRLKKKVKFFLMGFDRGN